MILQIANIQLMVIITVSWENRTFSYLFSYKGPTKIKIIQFPKADEELEDAKDKHTLESGLTVMHKVHFKYAFPMRLVL